MPWWNDVTIRDKKTYMPSKHTNLSQKENDMAVEYITVLRLLVYVIVLIFVLLQALVPIIYVHNAKNGESCLVDLTPFDKRLKEIGIGTGTDLDGKIVKIGTTDFVLLDKELRKKLIIAYHDLESAETLRVDHIVFQTTPEKGRGSKIFYPAKPIFYEHIDPELAYKQATQVATFGENNIKKRGECYLARGHLAPNFDQPNMEKKASTFYYINTFPQWQSINNGNWSKIERYVQQLAHEKGDLEVSTGTLGILTLPDSDKNLKKMFMAKTSSGKGQIPVPKYVYKWVYDRITNSAVVFITINNPYLTRVNQEDIICPDIMRDENNKLISGVLNGLNLDWDNKNQKGYTYCCGVKTFNDAVGPGYAPDLGDLPVLNLNHID